MLDFTDEAVRELFDEQIAKNPQLLGLKELDFIPRDVFFRLLAEDMLAPTKPGKPKGIPSKNNPNKTRIDWGAWFLWYELCEFRDIKVSFQDIADELKVTAEYVEKKFRIEARPYRAAKRKKTKK